MVYKKWNLLTFAAKAHEIFRHSKQNGNFYAIVTRKFNSSHQIFKHIARILKINACSTNNFWPSAMFFHFQLCDIRFVAPSGPGGKLKTMLMDHYIFIYWCKKNKPIWIDTILQQLELSASAVIPSICGWFLGMIQSLALLLFCFE